MKRDANAPSENIDSTARAPRVSVILAAYNSARYLQRSIESILTQEYRDLELIVVDDGSTDNTDDILSRYADLDPRLRFVRNGENRGIVFSRNRGLQLAKGELLAGQDADDVSLPERLGRQVEFLDAHPEVGLVGTWASFIDENGTILPRDGLSPAASNAELQKALIDVSTFCCATVMLRRRLLALVGLYDPRFPYSNDYEWLLRLSEVTQMGNLTERLYLYRRHRDAVTSRHRSLQMFYKAQALEEAAKRRWQSCPPLWVSRTLGRDYLRASYLLFVGGQNDLASAAYKAAVCVAPNLDQYGPLLEEVLTRYLLREMSDEALTVDRFLVEICGDTRHVHRVRAHLSSLIRMRAIFESSGSERTDRMRKHLWPAISSDPRWLFNAGVLTMVLKAGIRSRAKGPREG